MHDQPIITTILDQKCIGYEATAGRFMSIIRNVGIDASGTHWTWDTEAWADVDGNEMRRDRKYYAIPQEDTTRWTVAI